MTESGVHLLASGYADAITDVLNSDAPLEHPNCWLANLFESAESAIL